MKKIYLQCGYEDDCKKRDCLNCPRKRRYNNIILTQAEESAIEDFAVCDLKSLIAIHSKETELSQKIMYNIMKKIFKKQNRNQDRIYRNLLK